MRIVISSFIYLSHCSALLFPILSSFFSLVTMRARTGLNAFRIQHHDEWITIIQMKNLSKSGEKKWTQWILSIFDFSSYHKFICRFVISLLFVTHQLKRTFRHFEPVCFPLSKLSGAKIREWQADEFLIARHGARTASSGLSLSIGNSRNDWSWTHRYVNN